MGNTVFIEDLYALRTQMEAVYEKNQEINALRSRLKAGEPMLPLYNPSSALRDLPPPWAGHGFSLFCALWILLLDIWSGGLFGGLLFLLLIWLRVKKFSTPWKQTTLLIFAILLLPILFMVFVGKLLDGGSLTMVAVLAFAAWLLGGLLMVSPKVKANIQIREENQARVERNEALELRNRKIWEQISHAAKQMEALDAQLQEMVVSCGYPPDYATLNAINMFIRYMKNSRADTYAGMISLYEESMHRWRMETEAQKQTAILQQQEEAMRYQNELTEYSNMLQAFSNWQQWETNNHLQNISNDLSALRYRS